MGCAASTQKRYPKAAGADPVAGETMPDESAPRPPAPAADAPEGTPAVKAKSEDEDSDEDDVLDDTEFEKNLAKVQQKGARLGISAERTEVDENWKPPVFEKTPEQDARLRAALGRCFMFSVLEEEQLQVVVKAFQETPASAGQTVITQGAQVSASEPALFVIESGQLSVFKTGIEKSVFTYTNPGQYFGDLALLYNAPRAATIIADTDSLLWSIDRDTFNNLVKDAARQQMQKRLGFLEEVPCLKGLDAGERMSVCDAMQVRIVHQGDVVIKQGDLGTDFFIVESGRAEARKDGVAVMQYESKNFFGELALIKQAPRAADVVALETCRLLVLGSESFRRMLGPLDEILKERAESYANVDLAKFQ